MMTLEEQLEQERELWRLKNLISSQGAGDAISNLQAPNASTPMAEEATTRTALQQQAITKARNAEYAGASAVQDVDAGRGALGNIAKVLTAWGVAKQGKKRNEAAAGELGKSIDAENVLAKTLAAEKEKIRREDIDRTQRNLDRTSAVTSAHNETTSKLLREKWEYEKNKPPKPPVRGYQQIIEGENKVTYPTTDGVISGEAIGSGRRFKGKGGESGEEDSQSTGSKGYQSMTNRIALLDEWVEAGYGRKATDNWIESLGKKALISSGASTWTAGRMGELQEQMGVEQVNAFLDKLSTTEGFSSKNWDTSGERKLIMETMSDPSATAFTQYSTLAGLAERAAEGSELAALAPMLRAKARKYQTGPDAANPTTAGALEAIGQPTQEEIAAELRRRGLL